MTGPDINNMDLSAEVIETDQVSAEDFFKRLAPIDDGEHLMIATLSQRGIEVKPSKPAANGQPAKPPFLMVNVQFQTTEEPKETCFDNPNSVVFTTRDGKRTSRLHMFLDALGAPFSGSNLQELKDHCEQALAQNPQIWVTTRWEAQYEDQSKPEKSPDRFVVFKTGQKNFPPEIDADGQKTGRYLPDVTDTKTGREGSARAQVQRYRKA